MMYSNTRRIPTNTTSKPKRVIVNARIPKSLYVLVSKKLAQNEHTWQALITAAIQAYGDDALFLTARVKRKKRSKNEENKKA